MANEKAGIILPIILPVYFVFKAYHKFSKHRIVAFSLLENW